MAIVWYEHPESRTCTLETSTRVYVCLGTSREVDVYATATGNIPTTDERGFLAVSLSIDPETTGDTEDDFSWHATVDYQGPSGGGGGNIEDREGHVSYEFDVSASSAHISHALHQTEYPGNLVDDAGSLKRAIESTYEGDVRGIDIPVPDLKLIVTKVWPRAFWSGSAGLSNAIVLGRTVGKTNDRPWWTFDRGEVQFLGARPEKVGLLATRVTYVFSCSENRRNIAFGEMANGFNVALPLKRGHEYVWVYHKRQEVPNPAGAGTVMVAKPWSVQVAQVFEEENFSIFGLPNAPP